MVIRLFLAACATSVSPVPGEDLETTLLKTKPFALPLTSLNFNLTRRTHERTPLSHEDVSSNAFQP